jgi:methylmalonyl-CoA mutase
MSEPETPLSLTADFPAATRADWRKLVDAVLKGAPFERLESKTADGLTIAPLYERATDAKPVAGRAPGAAWRVMQRVDHPDPAAANAQARDDLGNGATGLVLVFKGSVSANGFGLDAAAAALAATLDGIALDGDLAVDLNLSPATRHVVRDFSALVKSRGNTPAKVDLRASINPIGGFAAAGTSAQGWNALAKNFAAMIGELLAAGFRGPFAVSDGRIIHNAGGSEAQELGFALASAVAYLRALEGAGVSLAAARDAVYFRLSADADQFLTLTKFRAVRKLWARVQTACGLTPQPGMITAETAWRMLTRCDPYVNILRNTIAVAAAGLGGADAITVLPHTAPLGLPDAFARRIARNAQLLLLEESSLARVADPAAGSGALEALTEQLCTAAWSLFQDIERAGGAWAALERGLIQQQVAAVRAGRQKAIAQRRDILTGTNAYPDLHETAATVLDAPPWPEPEPAEGASRAALPRIRLAEPFEQLRDASDRMLAETGTRPKVFLACLGPQADFTPCANFARSLFESGGIEAVEGQGEAGTLGGAFKNAGTPLACLCASDRTYDSAAAPAAAALQAAGARQIYMAGRPGPRETEWRAAGVQSFIHEGCDALLLLQAAYQALAG